MHVLALVNQKGGCGKTTAAVNLAGALAAQRESVLLVDLDPQAHATQALGCAVGGRPSMVDVLSERCGIEAAVRAAPGGIALLPATAELAEFEEVAARMIAPEKVLQRALAQCASRYAFVLLDCPPRVDGVLAANALRASDTAVLIVETGAFALQGALKAVSILGEVSATLDQPFALRALATLFDRRLRIAREVLIGIQAQLGPVLFETVVHDSVRLREAAASGVPVEVLDPGSRAAADFRALAGEVRAHALVLSRARAVAEGRVAPSLRADVGEVTVV